MSLNIHNLQATLEDGTEILKGVTLEIPKGEVHAIMGPNGSGKSTLSKVIAGHEGYTVTGGSVTLDGEDIAEMSIDERARAGIFLAFQYPSEVPGVSNANFIRAALQARLPEGEEIEHKMLSNAIEKAQMKIETNNYGIRENLLKYDEVMNDQREVIYAERRKVLDGDNMRDVILKMVTDIVENAVDLCITEDQAPEDWDLNELNTLLLSVIPLKPITIPEDKKIRKNELKHMLKEEAIKLYESKEAEFPEAEQIREIERVILLKVIDNKWMSHIDDMDQLRQSIGLQAYGQRDPLVEYKMNGYQMFDEMIAAIREETVRVLFHIRVEQKVEREPAAKVTGTNKDESAAKAPVKKVEAKVYPNDPCPCGSGKKYKQCCGRKIV